jgi:hypothetical protein
VVDDFVIARNQVEGSSLPYLLRVPLGEQGVVLKARERWPRTGKVYCHRAEGWPEDAEVVERVPVRSCVRRGAAVDLVLDRSRENRSQFVMTTVRGGRQVIFWQTSRTSKQARPRVAVPSARAQGIADLEIVVDPHERYAYTFKDSQVRLVKGALPAGDYAVRRDGGVLAAVERKSLDDLVSGLTTGRLKYQLTELAALPRAAVVVEERYSRIFQHKVVRGSVAADALAELQVAWPGVPVVFCETRALAQDWTYRFLAAAMAASELESGAAAVVADLVPGAPLGRREPKAAEVRAWAAAEGVECPAKGRVPKAVRAAYDEAHGSG